MAAAAIPAIMSLIPMFMQMFQNKGSSSGGTNQGDEFQKLSTMTGGQENILSQLMSQMGGPLSSGMSNLSDILSNKPEAFAKFEQPYMTQFQQQTVPGLAERFAGIGSGAQGSSAFGQALGGAASGLHENLAAMRGNMQQNAMSQLMQMLQTGLGTQAFGYGQRERSPGFLESILPSLAKGAGQVGTQYLLNKWKL